MDYEVGIVGLGDMGKLYVDKISTRFRMNVCDLPSNFSHFKDIFRSNSNVVVWPGAVDVVRRSDFMYDHCAHLSLRGARRRRQVC